MIRKSEVWSQKSEVFSIVSFRDLGPREILYDLHSGLGVTHKVSPQVRTIPNQFVEMAQFFYFPD